MSVKTKTKTLNGGIVEITQKQYLTADSDVSYFVIITGHFNLSTGGEILTNMVFT